VRARDAARQPFQAAQSLKGELNRALQQKELAANLKGRGATVEGVGDRPGRKAELRDEMGKLKSAGDYNGALGLGRQCSP